MNPSPTSPQPQRPLPGTLVKLGGLLSPSGRALNGKHAFVTETTATAAAAGRAMVLPLPYRRGARPIAVMRTALTVVSPTSAATAPELCASYASAVRAHSTALLREDRASAAVAQLDTLLSTSILADDSGGNTSDAETDLEDAPVDAAANAANAPPTRVDVLALRGYALRGAERYTEAIDALQSVLAKPRVPPRVRAHAQSELALAHILNGGNLSAAMDVVENMLEELVAATAEGGPDAGEGEETDSDGEDDVEAGAEGSDDEDEEDDDDNEGDPDDERIGLDGAIARAADEALHVALEEEVDPLIRRSAEALLRVRPNNSHAVRALGEVLIRQGERARGEELVRKSDALDEAAEAAIPEEGALVRISGLHSSRSLNGRYATVTGIEVEPDAADVDAMEVGVVLLPFDDKNGITCIAPANLEVVETPCAEWPGGLVDQYVDGVTEAAGMSMETGSEADVTSAQAMCARAMAAVRGVDTPKTLPTLMYVYWLALRSAGNEDGAKRVCEEVRALNGKNAAAVLAEMER